MSCTCCPLEYAPQSLEVDSANLTSLATPIAARDHVLDTKSAQEIHKAAQAAQPNRCRLNWKHRQTLMSPPPVTVFLSHSHIDKRVARCLVRRMSAHGVDVWIDERELRLGATLTAFIRDQIEQSDLLLVVVSQASAASTWVEQEVHFARQHRKPIIPLFIDSLGDRQRFRDDLGIDASSLCGFADVVDKLLRDVFRGLDRTLPPLDRTVLSKGLRQLAIEEPDLAPLILGCLDSEGLHIDNIGGVHQGAFHPLDDALNSLFDLSPNTTMADHAAKGFRLEGAGSRALFSWIRSTGDGGTPLAVAVGGELKPAATSTALQLLAACNPPNNSALYSFIDGNAGNLDAGQRRAAIRLVTWPVRNDTANLSDVLGWVACKQFPEAEEIRQMWRRWIRTGGFDRQPEQLAGYLADADKEGLPGWAPAHEDLRSHVRGYLRSGDGNKVRTACKYISTAASHRAPVLELLLHEARLASGSAEWNTWSERDPEAAAESERWLENTIHKAQGS